MFDKPSMGFRKIQPFRLVLGIGDATTPQGDLVGVLEG